MVKIADASLLDDTNKNVHYRLYSVVLDALRTDYRCQPNAPRLVKFVRDMAAAIDPAVLKDWSDKSCRSEVLNRKLNGIAQEWAHSVDRASR